MTNDYCCDTDFGGDDLKLVEYDVVYDEYCEEAWVGRGRTLINYATTAEAFASTALGEFRALIDKGSAQIIDPRWNAATIDEILSNPQDRRRRFLYTRCPRIVDRWPRRERSCERDEVSVLNKINNTLEQIARNKAVAGK
jgi:hypothetical protein